MSVFIVGIINDTVLYFVYLRQQKSYLSIYLYLFFILVYFQLLCYCLQTEVSFIEYQIYNAPNKQSIIFCMVHTGNKKHTDKLFHKSKVIYTCLCGLSFRLHPSLIKHLTEQHKRHSQIKTKLVCNLTPDFEEYEVTDLEGPVIKQISPVSIKYGGQKQQSLLECEQESSQKETLKKKTQQVVSSYVIQKNQIRQIEPFMIQHLPFLNKRGRPSKDATSNQIQNFSFILKGNFPNYSPIKYGQKVLLLQPTGTWISKLMVQYLISKTPTSIDKERYLKLRQAVGVFTLLLYCERSYIVLRHLMVLQEKDLIHLLNYFSTSYLPSSLKFLQIRDALERMDIIDLFIKNQYMNEICDWIDWCHREKASQVRVKVNRKSAFFGVVMPA